MKKTKVLVANRSEIACRVFQACREMGLSTVGIFAPGDEEARHVTYAEEVWKIPSYLDAAAILKVAKDSGAGLIHPGYGFLSERPIFAQAVEDAGLIFIGPKAQTMELMGGKIAAKEFAALQGVPTLPWAKVERGQEIRTIANQVGYPLLLKASSGGGGKGMRRVDREADLSEAAESASAEALSAFGDGTLFLERLLVRPRHIEVQVFGDGKGGGVHLHERECSLQRRHQKVWEEATAPHLSQKTREGLFAAALRLVKATKYRNAGTVEFLVDGSGGFAGGEEGFFFLEMNTRLQVEHPVTEFVTGIDLVRAQILQAQNPEMTFLKDSPSSHGHAIEVRLYAEDPAQDFMPTPGKITRLSWPTGAGIRVESGIEQGQLLGTQFDSMLGKLIVSAETRDQALKRLCFALEETVILGVGTNQAYLRALADHPKVIDGRVDTDFLSQEFAGYAPHPSEEDLSILASLQSAGLGEGMHGSHGANGPLREGLLSPWVAFAEKGK